MTPDILVSELGAYISSTISKVSSCQNILCIIAEILQCLFVFHVTTNIVYSSTENFSSTSAKTVPQDIVI